MYPRTLQSHSKSNKGFVAEPDYPNTTTSDNSLLQRPQTMGTSAQELGNQGQGMGTFPRYVTSRGDPVAKNTEKIPNQMGKYKKDD